MTDQELREAIREVVEPAGSMAPETIAAEAADYADVDERDARVAVTRLISNGVLEEHPEFEGSYRLSDS